MKKNKKISKRYHLLNLNWNKILKLASTATLAYTVSLTPAFSQQIITDGYTNTQLNITNRTTNVTTSTVRGSNAFNSFSKFNVENGNVVNLHLPSGCNNLINLIKDQTSNINGILNSIQNGKIGGNIFLVNPYGITVGSQGIINVGSLTAITPANDFVNNFFDSPGNPNTVSVDSLINGEVERNNSAQFINNGIINAIDSVKIDSGEVVNSGNIYTGAVFEENDIETGDIVNLNTLESGLDLVVRNGQAVIISAKNFINNGTIVADGANSTDAGNVNITATNDITLNTGSIISTKGKGSNSNGGDIYIFAENNAYFEIDAIIDARGGNVSGDGGIIELSSNNQVKANGTFYASPVNGEVGNIIIDPVDLVINTNQILPGVNILWEADNSVTIDGAIVSTRVIGGSTDYANALSTGVSGSLMITAPNITITNNSEIYTHTNNGYKSNFVYLDADASEISGVEDASAKITIEDSTITANNFVVTTEAGEATSLNIANACGTITVDNSTLTADESIVFVSTGGAASGTNEAYADGEILVDNSSEFTARIDISLMSTAGAALSTNDAYAGAIVQVTSSTFNADRDILFTSGATTALGNANTDVQAIARTILSNFTAGRDINFTSQGGIAMDPSTNDSIAVGESSSTFTRLTTGRDLIFRSSGGLANGDTYGAAVSGAFVEMSLLDIARNLTFESCGGEVSSVVEADAGALAFIDIGSIVYVGNETNLISTGGTAESASDAYGDAGCVLAVSELITNGNVTFTATGGSATGFGDIDSSAYAIIEEGFLDTMGKIHFESTATQVGQPAEIEIDADSEVYSGDFSRVVLINPDGSINDTEYSIYTEITDTTINVGNVTGGGITLIANKADGPGEIYGSGELNVYRGFQSVSITNQSNLKLVINDIDSAINGFITKTGNYTGSFTENINVSNTPKEIVINNNGTSSLTFAGNISNPNGVTKANSNGNIILNSGTAINSGAINNAIVLNSNNGNFINNSGANALIANNDRWLVYADNPFDSIEGGLDLNRQYNENYTSMPPDSFTKTGNYILYSYAPVLTFTADDKSRTYGDNNPDFTSTVTGLVEGDTLSEAYSGSGSFTTAANKSSNAGTYSIKITDGSLASDMGYQFNFVNGTLTIDKANLTVTADNKIKVFGNNNPQFTASYNGFVLGQNASTLGGNLIFITNATKNSYPGIYIIDPSGLISDNYNITFEPGNLIVTPGGNDPNGIFETIVGRNTKLSLDNVVPNSSGYPLFNINTFLTGNNQNNNSGSPVDSSALTNQ